MATDLLERKELLTALTGCAQAAAAGHGATVLVSGEAGIGKLPVDRITEVSVLDPYFYRA